MDEEIKQTYYLGNYTLDCVYYSNDKRKFVLSLSGRQLIIIAEIGYNACADFYWKLYAKISSKSVIDWAIKSVDNFGKKAGFFR